MKNAWNSLREELCLVPTRIQLNTGSCSPVAKSVLKKAESLRQILARDPMHFLYELTPSAVEDSRESCAKFFNCPAKDLLFFSNISHAINTFLQSFPFQKGAKILTTTEEYPHFWNLFKHIENTKGCKFERIKLPFAKEETLNKEKILELFKKHKTPDTQGIFISHLSCQTGLVLPVQEICDWANKEGLFTVIDGAHAVGAVPVDLNSLNCTFYAANLHKWMMGLTGSAFLYVNPKHRSDIKPLCWTTYYPQDFTNSFEYQGTRDLTPWLVVKDAIEFYNKVPLLKKRERYLELRNTCIQEMEEQNYTLISPRDTELSSCLVSFALPHSVRSQDVIKYLRVEHNLDINLPFFENGTFCLRLCPTWFHTEEEIYKGAKILGKMNWSQFKS